MCSIYGENIIKYIIIHMATITQNNVNFNNVPVGSGAFNGWGTKYTNSVNLLEGKYDPDPENVEKSFNAIEIDWNGAQLGNKLDPSTLTPGEAIIIETTGQLLSYISTISDKITTLENILINL
jgi:hypothetical protein